MSIPTKPVSFETNKPRRGIDVMNVGPVHPGRGEPSFIEMRVVLRYLKGEPVETIVIEPEQAVSLIEQLALGLRVTAFKRT